MAIRYKKLPSELIENNWDDFQIDYLCYEAGLKAEKFAMQKAEADRKKQEWLSKMHGNNLRRGRRRR
jgi:hypothetical protein